MWARLITSARTETGATWTNKPTWTSTGSNSDICAESTTLSCVFDVKNWVQDWVDSDVDNHGIWLDTNGNNETYWKRLLASEEVHSTTPRLYVTHHDPITLGYPNGGRTSSRTLNWTRDPAWGQTTYQAQVATDSGFTNIVAQSGAQFGSGGTWTVPLSAALTSGTTYQWRVAAKTVGGAWSSWTEGTFTYDLSLLGSQAQHRDESWDLGSGDSLAVDASNLNAVVSHPIVSLPYRGSSLSLGLTYNAHDPDDAGFGRGWRLDMGRRLVVNGTTSVTFIDQTGARHTFTNPVTSGTVTTYTRPPTTARRALACEAEAGDLESALELIVTRVAPELLAEPGVGVMSAARLLNAWSHQGRIRSETAFASLAGVSPIPASSGQTTRHRLNRSGDRQLNRALHTIVLSRLQHHPETRAYAERRRAEGRTAREIKRCLKRFAARGLFRLLERSTLMA